MNNLLSYCGLVEVRISASEKDLPVMKTNTGEFVVFRTKHKLKCQFSGITEIL